MLLPAAKRRKPNTSSIPKRDVQVEDIARERAHSEFRLRLAWEDIIKRYSDPNLTTDEIKLDTGEVLVDNGHLKGLQENKQDVWRPGKDKGEKEEEEEVDEEETFEKPEGEVIRMCAACEELDELEGVECTHLNGDSEKGPAPVPALTPASATTQAPTPSSNSIMKRSSTSIRTPKLFEPQPIRARTSIPENIWTDAPILQRDLIWHEEDDPIPNLRRDIESKTERLAGFLAPVLNDDNGEQSVSDNEDEEAEDTEPEEGSIIPETFSDPMILIPSTPGFNRSEYMAISPYSTPRKDLVVREMDTALSEAPDGMQDIGGSPSPMVTPVPAASASPVSTATRTLPPLNTNGLHLSTASTSTSTPISTESGSLLSYNSDLPSPTLPVVFSHTGTVADSFDENRRPRTPGQVVVPGTPQMTPSKTHFSPRTPSSVKNTYSKKPRWKQNQSSPLRTPAAEWWRQMSPELDSPAFSHQPSSALTARVRYASPELAPLPPLPIERKEESLEEGLEETPKSPNEVMKDIKPAKSSPYRLPELKKHEFKTPFKKPAKPVRTPLSKIRRENSVAPKSAPRPAKKKTEVEKRRWSLLDLASDEIMIADDDEGFSSRRKGKKPETPKKEEGEKRIIKKESTPFVDGGTCGENGYSCGRCFCFQCL